MAKVMKRRLVKIRVWIVKSDSDHLPAFNPTEDQLEKHLNKIFEPQINTTFKCFTLNSTIGPFGWDSANDTTFGAPVGNPDNYIVKPNNGGLDFTTEFQGEMRAIRLRQGNQGENYVDTYNLNMYIVGGASWLAYHSWDGENNELKSEKIGGIARTLTENTHREIWLPGETVGLDEGLHNAAHEVGHFIIGDGHPLPDIIIPKNAPPSLQGPAPLPGTDKGVRLMCNLTQFAYPGNLRRLTVKGEWDAVKTWIDKEINADRMEDE